MKLDRRYNIALLISFIGIALLVCGLFVWQMQRQVEDEWLVIESQLNRHQQQIEGLLRACTHEIESLRAVALQPPSNSPIWPSTGPDGRTFSLDHIAYPDLWGNLVGRVQKDPAQTLEIRRALMLAPWMSALSFKLPAISKARYVSKHELVLVHPWKSSEVMSPDDWLLPALVPGPQRRWGEVRFEGQDRGLQATLQVTVQNQDQPMGLIELELSLDHLNRLNTGFNHPLGHTFIVNEQQQVLAHPELYAQALQVKSPPTLASTEVGAGHNPNSWPAKTRISVDQTWFYRIPFRSAPWSLIYVVDSSVIWSHVWHIQRGIFIELMLGLMGLMLLACTLTRRQFVRPTPKLIQFLGHAAKREQVDVPDVPKGWLPWFDRVKDMMQESRKLMAVEQELLIASQMQQSILPLDWPSDPCHALHGFMRAARHVGGDFYDHVTVPGQPLNLIIGDVSGNGIAAALFGMVSKTQYRGQIAQVEKLNRPDELLAGMNRALAESNPQSMFVTGLCASYEPGSGLLRWSGAGHLAPLLLACDGTVTRLQQAQGIALGLDAQAEFPLHSLQLQPGDQVVWFTDGVTESIDPDQNEFGLDRLIEVLQRQPLAQGQALIEHIMIALAEFVQGAEQFDDITCLVLHRKA